MCKSFVAVDMKNIPIWLVNQKTNTPPFWRNTILLSLPASMMGKIKRLLWASATTRDLAADFLLSNFADAHTQHNKKFD